MPRIILECSVPRLLDLDLNIFENLVVEIHRKLLLKLLGHFFKPCPESS